MLIGSLFERNEMAASNRPSGAGHLRLFISPQPPGGGRGDLVDRSPPPLNY